MRLCAVIRRGAIVEVSMVADDHKFGTDGDHSHIPVVLTEKHACQGQATRGIIDKEAKEGRII